jgi:hypothetical protein
LDEAEQDIRIIQTEVSVTPEAKLRQITLTEV